MVCTRVAIASDSALAPFAFASAGNSVVGTVSTGLVLPAPTASFPGSAASPPARVVALPCAEAVAKNQPSSPSAAGKLGGRAAAAFSAAPSATHLRVGVKSQGVRVTPGATHLGLAYGYKKMITHSSLTPHES